MKSKIIGLIVAGLVVLAFAYNLPKGQETNAPKTLKMGEAVLNIEVADTNIEREKGLSGRDGLAEDEGLLFVFAVEGFYGFWMKDMKFPIDIAWLDKDKKIIYMESNLSPETYPKIFNPPAPSLYVLETPAGFLLKNKAQIGDFVAF